MVTLALFSNARVPPDMGALKEYSGCDSHFILDWVDNQYMDRIGDCPTGIGKIKMISDKPTFATWYW